MIWDDDISFYGFQKRMLFLKKLERKDYSSECTMDEYRDEHCWSCIYFVFPIGCMKGEEELLEIMKGEEG